MGKGEIACYEQFLLFPQCFQKACFPEASKGVIVWEWVNDKTWQIEADKSCNDDKTLSNSRHCKTHTYTAVIHLTTFKNHASLWRVHKNAARCLH